MQESKLHLRTPKKIEDLSNKATLLLWKKMSTEKNFPWPDAHRFPFMSKAIHRLFQRRINPCPTYSESFYPGNYACAGAAESPPCAHHTRRLQKELGRDLRHLLGEVEKETLDFLSASDPERLKFKALKKGVHRASAAVAPYLYENIACSCCEQKPKEAAMFNIKAGQEIVIKTLNDIGVIADIARIVADKGIGILAVSCWVEGPEGIIHLVTDDNLRAGDALRKHKYDVQERKVLLVETLHKPGMLKHLTEALKAALIDIHHLYASADGAEKCLVVFSCSDHDRAIVELKKN